MSTPSLSDILGSWGAEAQQGYDALGNYASQAWNNIKPPSTAGLDQAAADSRSLEQMFLQQMQNQPYAPVPGISYAGSAPVVNPDGSVTPGAGAPGAYGGGPSTGPAPGTARTRSTPGAITGTPATQGRTPGLGTAQPGQAWTGTPQTPPPGGDQYLQGPPADPNAPGSALPGPGNPHGGGAASPSPGGGGFYGSMMNTAVGSPGRPPTPVGTTPASASGGYGGFGTGGQTGSPPPQGWTAGGPGGANTTYVAPGPPPAAPGMMAASMGKGATIDQSQEAQFRAGQMGLAANLAGVLSGQAPSVAQLQQQQAFGQQEAQQQGLAAAMGRGGNTALALRTAAGNMGQLGAQQAAASAILRAQEQATARGQMGEVLNSGRAQDIGLAGQQAGLQQQASQTNAQLLQQANANNQASQIQTRGQNIQNTAEQQRAILQANQNQAQAYGTAYNAQSNRAQQYGNLYSQGLSAAALLSDKRQKEKISATEAPEFDEFLSKIAPKSFSYKGDQQRHVGVMAQDVEKSKIGSTMVKNTPVGKMIDVPQATGGMMAALADMHKRVSKLEGRKKAA